MPRKPVQTYPVDDDWRKRVELRLKEKQWTRSDLAREAGVSKSTITELLNGGVKSNVDVPKIHRALDWPWEAALSVVSGQLGQLINMWDALDDFGSRARAGAHSQRLRRADHQVAYRQARVIRELRRPRNHCATLPIQSAMSYSSPREWLCMVLAIAICDRDLAMQLVIDAWEAAVRRGWSTTISN